MGYMTTEDVSTSLEVEWTVLLLVEVGVKDDHDQRWR